MRATLGWIAIVVLLVTSSACRSTELQITGVSTQGSGHVDTHEIESGTTSSNIELGVGNRTRAYSSSAEGPFAAIDTRSREIGGDLRRQKSGEDLAFNSCAFCRGNKIIIGRVCPFCRDRNFSRVAPGHSDAGIDGYGDYSIAASDGRDHLEPKQSTNGQLGVSLPQAESEPVNRDYRRVITYGRSHYRSLPGSSADIRGPPRSPSKFGAPFNVAENGSYYGETSKATGRPKTVHVQGYYRKDGTYVRGHYRSKPR